MFGGNQKRKRQPIAEDMPRIDLKGHKMSTSVNPEASPGAIERQFYQIDRGPRMLPRKIRFKVWAALLVLGGWFLGCYSLVAYRLKSDDLELMEREVYEELQKKKEVERYLQRQRRVEDDKIVTISTAVQKQIDQKPDRNTLGTGV